MQSPYFFESCQKLDGRVHYYDITSIAKLINQRLLLDKPIGSIEDLKKKTPQDIVAEYVNQDQDFKKWYRDNKRMIIKCRLSECRGDIDLEKAVFSESLMKTLEMFNENIEKRNNEINQLTVEKRLDKLNIQNLEIKNGEKDIKIGGLENENSDLKGRVTVLTEENSSQEQRLDQFVDLVKDQRKTIESREKQIVQLKKDPEYKTIKEMITGNALFARYSRKDWNKKTSEQRKDAEYWLMLILKGRTLERHNAFVTQNTLENHDEHHRKVFENFLNGREQQVISSVRNSMKYLSFDLVDTFIIGEYQIRYNDQEFDLFLKPIMERIFSEGRVLDRITNITKDQQVYIQNFPSEEWDRKESNRAFPLTYQETLSSISSRVLKLELCDQITRSIS